MGHTKTIIELNGKRYDAISGTLLDSPTDGHATHDSAVHHVPVRVHKPSARPSGRHVVHHTPQRSKTLMRHAVKKPVFQVSSAIVEQETTEQAMLRVNEQLIAERLARAKQIHKNKLVNRFGQSGAPVFVKKVEPLPVKPAPHAKSGHNPKPATKRPASGVSVQHHTHHTRHVESVLAEGLRKASSFDHSTHHKQPKRHRLARKLGVSSKTANLGASVTALLLLAGFTYYQNVPNLAMRTAASKAGIQASLPAYHPSGFSMSGPIEYAPGRVTVSFRSNSDSREYKVIQQVSNWNSEALLGNYVAKNYRNYQSYRQGDRTVYIYEGANASWVEDGIWYQISGKSALNSEQLLNIAASM